jgi:hypothetical protein
VKKRSGKSESEDELRPEYDLSKMKLVGRGIFAERFRRGTNLAQLIERDRLANEEEAEVDDLRPEYNFSKMRIVKRGQARKRSRKER